MSDYIEDFYSEVIKLRDNFSFSGLTNLPYATYCTKFGSTIDVVNAFKSESTFFIKII